MTSGKPTPDSLPKEPLPRLLAVMAWLRDREHGCPWDIDQTFRTIAPYTIEEAYEVADAIERDDMAALKEELGDLLLQVVYHSQIASEARAFGFEDVAAAIAEKMVDRHPHVFGDMDIRTADAQTVSWEARKAAERAAKGGAIEGAAGALDGVARALPALMRAEKIQKRAARVGFDWPTIAPVIDKIEEELKELRAELVAGKVEQAKVADELGDVLFAVANLARHCKVDPEVALRATNDKFEKRFRHIERRLAESGRKPSDASLEEMEALWQEAKTPA
ncbi:MAG: nucleoside triphosphate pyrophosphohydrolase [Reyranella sp.]|uniref:nucleoside triphosphate pyrophosphohydrolase n=1 Tax=Reyranella sp. TaxID=1929291 RepID=UPI001206F957|nr:nucleoside triphosphate pyrophosphohydrolase [Reyranella sp.]TAJ86974.1 MAG: nucleoside triphosphate pyrophosphohydrolase [Reyranella sp.]TBR27581.1 MAG: nucleoside triphosphate pyrophosphohydrolase [Reyranella sp.]